MTPRCEDCGKELKDLSSEGFDRSETPLCDDCWHRSFEDFMGWQQEGGRYPEGYKPIR